MKQTANFKLLTIMTFLLIEFSGISYAQDQVSPANPLLTKEISVDEKTKVVSRQFHPLSLFTEWGGAVIDHTLLNNNKMADSKSLETLLANRLVINELFVIDKVKDLQQKINLRFQTGLYSLKNNYVLLSHHSPLISHQFLVPNLAQHGLYQFGRFRTETGYSDTSNDEDKNFKAFLHSAYSVIHRGRFDLSVTASIESIDLVSSAASFYGKFQPPAVISNNQQSTSATLGVVGSYDLSNHWSLIGAVTTSHLTNTKSNTLTVEGSRQKMALIGTTYSF